MTEIRNGWYEERNDMWAGFGLSIQVDEILHKERSPYQDILIFKSKSFGKVLVLDGIVQCTESDEFAYQEMVAHIPLNCHHSPKKVLIVGGGDGGVAREVLKDPRVNEIVICEIDQRVVDLSKQYLPAMAVAFDDPRVELYVGDGFEYMKKHNNEFDVIITDSSDPIGPATVLFQKQYYELMKLTLKDGGIACSQGQCIWLELSLIRQVMDDCRSLYPVVSYAYTTVPTYVGGQIGFIICSKDLMCQPECPVRKLSDDAVHQAGFKYYNTDVHKAAFTLPQFAKKALYQT